MKHRLPSSRRAVERFVIANAGGGMERTAAARLKIPDKQIEPANRKEQVPKSRRRTAGSLERSKKVDGKRGTKKSSIVVKFLCFACILNHLCSCAKYCFWFSSRVVDLGRSNRSVVRVTEREMTEVILHIYDVTNGGSEKTNNTVMQINKIFKDGIGLGGIFHSAVEVYGDEEWSFGFCEQGTGVFSFQPGKNPMYRYREKLVLGKTDLSIFKFNQILRELSREWPGRSYDLLSKNCNHFCDELCERLGVPKLPGWVNRFANAGDAAVVIAENTAFRLKQAKMEIVSASKVAFRYLSGIVAHSPVAPDNGGSSRAAPRFQATWLKNLVSPADKPSTSMVPNLEAIRQQQEDKAEGPQRSDTRYCVS
ncbi:hypothetical protein Nepgr_021480 [Nepenthes gracilis]|uniref:PPPDE domain-containing protein n=1 Tax=Nepenthes gracilis TaxID=150966 RepID=A0AAD3SZJ0_NEPGR|nr:hypothetical protein Nepgr_021480 [Nepenthes gracilis]